MFEKLDIFRMAQSMATHASARQSMIAGNIANADTPGYKTRDIASFADSFRNQAAGTGPAATRPTHLSHADTSHRFRPFTTEENMSPNGNSVSLEAEMMKSGEVRHQHETALAIYKSAMGILRTSLGRR